MGKASRRKKKGIIIGQLYGPDEVIAQMDSMGSPWASEHGTAIVAFLPSEIAKPVARSLSKNRKKYFAGKRK